MSARAIGTTVLMLSLVTATPPAGAQQPSAQARCAALSTLQVPGAQLSDVKPQWFAAGSPPPAEPPYVSPLAVKLPAYCRLDATLDRRTGADGRPYGIGFAIALPADWNGRLLFQGGGGLNGTVAPPLGRTGAGDAALARGFAVVTTDTGHKGEVFDATFMREQQAGLDFAYQAVGRVAVLAKQIVALHYGKPVAHAYFAGCSTGGREGMLMAQRYPTYFDGIVVGAPAMRTAFSHIGDEWVATMLNQAAPKDASGKPETKRALSDTDRTAIIDGFLNACDAGGRVEGRHRHGPDRLPVRREDHRVPRREEGRVPLDCAGLSHPAGVRRAAGLEGPAGLSGLPLRHRHHDDARASRGCWPARSTQSGPRTPRRRWTWTRGPNRHPPIRR